MSKPVRKQAGLPPIPSDVSPEQRLFFQAVRENLAVRMGQEGDPLEKGVTFRDLIGDSYQSYIRRAGGSVSGIGDGPGGEGEFDYSPPPALTNLEATGGFGTVYVTWDNPALKYNYYVEVWRSTVDALDLESIEMKLIGTSSAVLYVDKIDGDRSIFYYWVRAVKAIGSRLVYGPFNQTAGTPGQITLDPDYVISVLEGQLSESELAAELLTPIQAIPTIQTTLDDHGIRIPTVEGIVAQHAVDIPSIDGRLTVAEGAVATAETDITNLQASVVSAQNDIVANADAATLLDARVVETENSISAQAGEITSIQSTLTDLTITAFDSATNYAIGELFRDSNIVYEVIATQTQPNVAPPNATYYTPRPDYETIADTVSANAAAVASLDTRVTSAEGTITAYGADITLLQTDLATAEGGIAGNTSALSGLTTRVTTAEGTISAHSTDITSLGANVTAAQGDADANAAAVVALDTRVTSAEGTITSQSSDITALENTVNDPATGVAANATAASSLETRVTTAEGEITSISTDVTLLENTVNDPATGVDATSTALSLLDSRVTANEGEITSAAEDIVQLQADVSVLGGTGTADALDSLDVRVTANEQDITAQALDITTLSASVGDNTAAVQTKAEASVVSGINGEVQSIKAQYTVKLDVDGRVSGVGLMDDGASSSFIVSSDAAYFIDPGQSITEFNPAADYPSLDALRDTQLVFGYAQVEGMSRFVINVPAYIPEATITLAMMKEATINELKAEVADIQAADITIANIWEFAGIGGVIQSSNYIPGAQGWRLTQGGQAEFASGVFYGTVGGTGQTLLDVHNTANSASNTASLANTTANSKNRTFRQGSIPAGLNGDDEGDIWIDTSNNNKMYRWSGLTWQLSRDTGIDAAQNTANTADSKATDAKARTDFWVKPGNTRIDGNKIFTGDAYVDTLQIKGNAVTIPAFGVGTKLYGNGSYQTTSVATITLDVPGPVLIWWSIESDPYSGSAAPGDRDWQIRVVRNSTVIYSPPLVVGPFDMFCAGMWVDQNVPAGTHVYYPQWWGRTSAARGTGTVVVLGAQR